MGEGISYKGRHLGHVRFDDNGTYKLIFTAENLDSLATLLQIRPDEQVETEVRGQISYQEFRRDYLDKITGFYPTPEAWLLKNYKAKTIEELEKTNENNKL